MIGRWLRGSIGGRGCCEVSPDAATCPFRSLNDAAPGTRCRVRCLRGAGGVRQRLLDAGVLPGAEAQVLRSAPLHDPIEIRIGDSFITLRRTEAAMVGIDDG